MWLLYALFLQQCDKYPSAQHTPSSYRQQQQQRGTTFDCTDGDLGIGISHPLTYATIACVRRDGRYSRRPPRRQNSSETILPPPPSFYSADHPLIVSWSCRFVYNFKRLQGCYFKSINEILYFKIIFYF